MAAKAQQITQLDFFHLKQNKFWAFKQMGVGYTALNNIPGLVFVRLLGTGAGAGFSLFPDFSTYAVLLVWESQADADDFRNNSSFLGRYHGKCDQIRVLTLSNTHSHGKWAGQNPFVIGNKSGFKKNTIAVITRATLRWSRLLSFWKAVPKASKAIEKAKGVLYYKGICEWPFIQQATISLWQSQEDVMQFAYRSQAHASIVKTTRKKRWYKEDLFARFYLISDEYFK